MIHRTGAGCLSRTRTNKSCRRASAFFMAGIFMALLTMLAATNGRAAPANEAAKGDVVSSFNDYEAIRNVMNLYIEAGRQAKSEIMKPAFHKDAIIYGTSGAEVTGGPIQGLFDYVDAKPKAAGLQAEITAIDIANNIAHVRVESNNWNGARYSDMFLLLKDGDGWKIITKVYFNHK